MGSQMNEAMGMRFRKISKSDFEITFKFVCIFRISNTDLTILRRDQTCNVTTSKGRWHGSDV